MSPSKPERAPASTGSSSSRATATFFVARHGRGTGLEPRDRRLAVASERDTHGFILWFDDGAAEPEARFLGEYQGRPGVDAVESEPSVLVGDRCRVLRSVSGLRDQHAGQR